ncbi:hypothetical protein [Parasphingorhabdus pacifica]
MEAWRIAGTVLTTVVGGLLVLGSMGKVRDRRDRRRGDVARTGVRGLVIVLCCAALTATVFPASVAWAVVLAGALIAAILMVTG